METIRTILVDDEPGNIITLRELLKKYCPFIEVIATAEDIIQAEQYIQQHQPQLVLLDIEMPYGNGFDLLEKLRPANFEVIFVTAFDNYAIRAFKYAAIDYILKPVNISELQDAVEKVRLRINEKNVNSRIELLLTTLKPSQANINKVAFPTGNGLEFESTDNIIFIEACGSYCDVYVKDSRKKYIVSKNMGDIEQILPESIFYRIHNSYIINVYKVSKYHKGRGGYVTMENGTKIEVAVRKKDEFLARFKL